MDAADARRDAVEIARAIIAGEIDAIRGAWQLRTDHLPLRHERQHWGEAVLADRDRELATIELRWKPRAVAACANLVRRFETATTP